MGAGLVSRPLRDAPVWCAPGESRRAPRGPACTVLEGDHGADGLGIPGRPGGVPRSTKIPPRAAPARGR